MALSITSVEVSQGPTAGGNEVTIRGDGFLRTINQQDKIIQLAGATNPNESPYGDCCSSNPERQGVYLW